MTMIVAVPKETFPGETRVAITPAAVAVLVKSKLAVVVEAGAGEAAGFPDADYAAKGAKIAPRAEVFSTADILLQVRCSLTRGDKDFASLKTGALAIGFCDPLGNPAAIA